MNFEFEDRLPKVGDAVTLIRSVKLYEDINGFVITSQQLKAIERSRTLMYVVSMDNDSIVVSATKKKKSIGDVSLPISIFKVVKIPKMQDVITWLFDGQLVFPNN